MSSRGRLYLTSSLLILGLVVVLPVFTYVALQALREHQYSRMEKDIERACGAIVAELTYSKDIGIRPRAPGEPIRGTSDLRHVSGEEEGVPFREWRIQMGFAGYPESFLDSGVRFRLEQKHSLLRPAPVLRVTYASKEEERTLRGLVEGALNEHRLDYTVVVR